MGDFFKDKEYEGFDWLNKAAEPVIFRVNELFAILPSKVEISAHQMVEMMIKNDSHSIDVYSIIDYLLQDKDISESDINNLSGYYTAAWNETLVFDLKSIPDAVAVTLTRQESLTDEEIFESVAKQCRYLINSSYSKDFPRINEIIDIIGSIKPEIRSSRSSSKKIIAIADAFYSLIKDDKWRIRNMNIAIKAAEWIKLYLDDGNLAAFVNFTKLKCMVHSGDPIYSIQETV